MKTDEIIEKVKDIWFEECNKGNYKFNPDIKVALQNTVFNGFLEKWLTVAIEQATAETIKKVEEIIDEPIDKNLKMSLDPRMSMIDAILRDRVRIKQKIGELR